MAEVKTKPTGVSVDSFLKKVPDAEQRADSYAIMAMMKDITGFEPKMWGPSMIGFGDYHYQYESGHEGDCFMMGFSPRKGQMTLYFMPDAEQYESQLKKLGKHKTGKSCLYFKRLADVDVDVLREMFEISFARTKQPAQQNKRAKPVKKTRAKK